MKMQFKKLVAAGTLSALMMGATVGFAALKDYPSPFVTGSGVQSFVVVGAAADPADVVGAVDLAARLGGSVTQNVAVPGAVGGFSVSGEGKALDTATTRVFLNDDLGKTGLRTTLTKDDLPTLLAKGSFADTDGTHKYDLYIDMTPGTTNPTKFDVKYGKPGSSSSADPNYVIGEQSTGRLPTSPSTSEYLYKARVVFDVGVNLTNAVGKSIQIFGGEYTISADSTTYDSSPKLVLFGGADVQTLTGGQSITTTVGGTTYEVKLLGVQSDGKAVLQVGGTSETVAKGSTSSNFGDLKIYVKDTASLSTTDQTQNVATLLIGADKLTLTDGSKAKRGNNDDNVDGTLVALGVSSEKLNTITVYFGARSSTDDFLTAGAATYQNQLFSAFGVQFAGMAPALGGPGDDKIIVRSSGDNNLQTSFTDYNGNAATLNFGHKNTSADPTLLLGDSSANPIVVSEGVTVNRDNYIVLSAGGFPHMFQVSSVSLDGSTSAGIDLKDMLSGATTKVTTGPDNIEEAVIDGQTYYFTNNTATSFNVTWGTGANLSAVGGTPTGIGTYHTIWPKLKTQRGAVLAFVGGAVTGAINRTYELPTGAVEINATCTGAACESHTYVLTAWNREDGTSSSVTSNEDLSIVNGTNFQLGRTTTGGLHYRVTRTSGAVITIGLIGTTNASASPLVNASLVLVEEKDDAGSEGAILFGGATGTSGSNQLAGIAAVDPSGTDSGSQTWGSNSNKASTADIWGTLVVRDTATSAQPSVEVWYPDTQRIASAFVLQKDASTSSSVGVSGSTVKSASPVKTALGKLDSEVTSADKSTKNLVLVGGPAVNTLVAELAAAGKTKDVQWYRDQGAGTSLVDLVADAFASGKSALVVAGHSAADTRAATSALQNYDAYTWVGNMAVLKNGVISSTTA